MKYLRRGFSLIDLLVSMSIITLIMAVVLFSYRTFQDRITVSAASQEMAIVLRKAQSYSSLVKESGKTGDFQTSYGVYFNTSDPESYYLFADKNGDHKYTGDSSCSPSSECIEKGIIRNDAGIVDICTTDVFGTRVCTPNGISAISIVFPAVSFQAPASDAIITPFTSGGSAVPGNYQTVNVINSLPDVFVPDVYSNVTVTQTGSVSVGNISAPPATNHVPTITLSGSNPMTMTSGGTFTDPGATAADVEDGDLTNKIVTSGSVNPSVSGTYTLNYSVTDSGGLSTTTARTVIVQQAAANCVSGINLISTIPVNTLPIVVTGGNISRTAAYVASASKDTIQVVNVHNTATPSVVGTISTASDPTALAVTTASGGIPSYAFVTAYPANKLQIFDITNYAAMSLLGSITTDTYPMAVAVTQPFNSYVYVLSYTNINPARLTVYNASDPTNPTVAGSVMVPSATTMVAAGNYVYVGTMNGQFDVVDVSNPVSPTVVGSIAAGQRINALRYASGNYVYGIDRIGGTFYTFNVSNPANPTIAGSVPVPNYPIDLEINNSYALVSTLYSNGFTVLDISNPANPVTVGTSGNQVVMPQMRSISVAKGFGLYVYMANLAESTMQIFTTGCGGTGRAPGPIQGR